VQSQPGKKKKKQDSWDSGEGGKTKKKSKGKKSESSTASGPGLRPGAKKGGLEKKTVGAGGGKLLRKALKKAGKKKGKKKKIKRSERFLRTPCGQGRAIQREWIGTQVADAIHDKETPRKKVSRKKKDSPGGGGQERSEHKGPSSKLDRGKSEERYGKKKTPLFGKGDLLIFIPEPKS